MNLEELLGTLESPIVIRPTRRMTQGELETYLDTAANILRGNADHSEFRGYVFALLFYKRISISLNCKLMFLPPELVRYVIWHELCHLIEPNHSERFWMQLQHVEPRADALHGRMRDAWKFVPPWAQRGTGFLL